MIASLSRRHLIASAASGLALPAAAASSRPLRFVPAGVVGRPNPGLAAPVARAQTSMIWDMLYGQSAAGVATPQMVAGHDLSSDELTWRFRLRAGLRFHDGSRVRAADCVASIRRWAKR
ncbi:MAG: ABC transporter substrate-binding protein, partial [Acetobacteraceae bacterium]|nr:ABC transporter substrate-binding protein [Acetobacteraceae bacterium]